MTNKFEDMVPPQNMEAEISLLGALLIDKSSIVKIIGKINGQDFYKPAHRVIFETILLLYGEGVPIDLVTLTDRLTKDKKLDEVGGAAYLTALMQETPTAANIVQYLKIVKEKAVRRELRLRSLQILQEIESDKETAEIITESNESLSKLIVQPMVDNPILLSQFYKSDIPLIEYYITGLLPKKGKGMISATKGIGKSLLTQNLSLAMANEQDSFLDRFKISPAKVLYLDLEMGESADLERFQKMAPEGSENLYIKYLPSMNLVEAKDRQLIESWLAEFKIQVLVLDPLSNVWAGNPNDQQQVSEITGYLNSLIENYGISILVVHHWRKATKDLKTGGQMAAGSYRWEAWLDCHITLEGSSSNMTITSEKNRNAPAFKHFFAKLNEETLRFEFGGEYKEKIGEDVLLRLFEEAGLEKIAYSALGDFAKQKKICSRSKVYELIKEALKGENALLGSETVKNKKYLFKKADIKEMF